MCGIFAYKGKKQAAPIILEGLKRLEYRGYDSAGIAVMHDDGTVDCRRVVGTVSNSNPHYQGELEYAAKCISSGTVGIGHVRWATHGAVTEANAHPHSDCSGNIQVVCNGVIRNHAELRAKLEATGHMFRSECDTEVIAHLLEDCGSAERAVANLEGDYAFVTLQGGYIHAVSHGMPLHERIIDGDTYISSDPAAFPPYDEEDGKQGYVHHMLKEIHEQRTMPFIGQRLPEASGYVLVGSGSSYHAAMYGAALARRSGICAEAVIASEFDIPLEQVVVGVTQSGETYDVLQVLHRLKNDGHPIAVITNAPGSSAAKLTDDVILMGCGREIAVAATKTFTASLVIFQGLFSTHVRKEYDIEGIMAQAHALDGALSPSTVGVMVIGRGSSLPIAMEGALKIREVAYLNAWAVPAGEMKHGSLALVTQGYPVICVGPNLETAKAEIAARGGRIITVDSGDDIQDAITLQCIAYKTAVSLGIDPDRPRNLAKSVTVE